jgi:hypothetical protein
MATKDTIEIDVNVGEGVKSMKTLKKEFSDMQTELDGLVPGTQKYIQTLQKLGAVKDEIGDLKAEIQAFAGTDAKVAAFGNVIGGIASGFQAAQGAAALFGAESEEVQKALLKVQAASALADGIKGITAMGDSLKVAGNVAKQLITQIIGVDTYTKIVTVSTRIWNAVMAANPIMLIVAGIGLLVAGLYALNKAFDDNRTEAEKLEDAYQAQKKASEEIVKAIDNEITALSGLKENEQKILDLRKLRIEQAVKLAKQGREAAAAQVAQDEKELGFLDELTASVSELMGQEGVRQVLTKNNSIESRKLLNERVSEEKKAEAELSQFENEQRQKKIDADKVAADKYKAIKKQESEDAKAFAREVANYTEQQNKEREDKAKREKEAADKLEADETEKQIQADLKKFEEDKAKRLAATDKYNEEVKASNAAVKDAEYKSVDAMRSLSEGFFAFKMRAARGNAAEELKIRKQQFAVDKAFNLARAIQDGIRSVQAALTIPPPGGQILAGVNAAIAAGNVAKLAASTFEGGGSSDVGGGALGLSVGSSFSQAPTLQSGNNQTQLNSDGSVNKPIQQQVIKAYVVESESAAVTKRVNKLTEQSKI